MKSPRRDLLINIVLDRFIFKKITKLSPSPVTPSYLKRGIIFNTYPIRLPTTGVSFYSASRVKVQINSSSLVTRWGHPGVRVPWPHEVKLRYRPGRSCPTRLIAVRTLLSGTKYNH